ncbi:Protein of unknown function DUF2829 [Ruminiclostridium papyrosolvens DSM 2782]|uniref:Thoeris anti-defense 2-like domain-containing protein n=1 Tax=Ruminiclostridium papyrosolvens DSM 2782 TaxID=588581 RepID=F1TEG3_9FIRM|nr:DUF2829 domain-containing protein [Ruminiclostridium papyrosolvens]EGD47129.1 Protein of unknown function DUF2829 [Ruminiclostridium papyrosolvens DSM 2782]WES36071.1 DUF2829 domain-containing protein [Ruminiclostridium papyrosolvens DSM 2782]WES36169.1 DUF2829 domain-containing protein [Ruminiclostridium papyrosolvens DSM 2782]
MIFKQAFEAMKQGMAVKLPSWKGYWKWQDGTIKMYCKDGRILDIRESEEMLFTLTNICSDEWEVVGEIPTDLNIQTFTFGEAIRNMKNGKKVARKGWNGKGMCLQAQIPDEHSKMTFPYLYMTIPDCSEGIRKLPWQPAQVDVFSEDWVIVE